MNECNRCGTTEAKLRLSGYCVWCRAVLDDRPDDAAPYGDVTDFVDENPQKRKCPECSGVMAYHPHYHGRGWAAYVCPVCEARIDE